MSDTEQAFRVNRVVLERARVAAQEKYGSIERAVAEFGLHEKGKESLERWKAAWTDFLVDLGVYVRLNGMICLPEAVPAVNTDLASAGGLWSQVGDGWEPVRKGVFCNFRVEAGDDGKPAYYRLSIREIDQCLLTEAEEQSLRNGTPPNRTSVSPYVGLKRIGARLFYDELEPDVKYLDNQTALFRLLQDRGQVAWKGHGADALRRNFVTPAQFHDYLASHAPAFDAVEPYPLFPSIEGTYTPVVRRIHPERNDEVIGEFLGCFNPKTKADRALLEAAFLTVLWGGPPGTRPVFVVVGPQESGKSWIARSAGSLVGGSWELKLPRGFSGDGLAKQLLSDQSRKHRVQYLDNVRGLLDSPELEAIVTSEWINGRASHDRDSSRLNLLTLFVTTTEPDLTRDAATRSAVVEIDSPLDTRGWEAKVTEFLEGGARYEELVAAFAWKLLHGERRSLRGKLSRFPEWDEQVLSLTDQAEEAHAVRFERSRSVNSEEAERSMFVELVLQEIARRRDEFQRTEYKPAENGSPRRPYTDQEIDKVFPPTMTTTDLTEQFSKASGRRTAPVTFGRQLSRWERDGKLPTGLVKIEGRKRGAEWSISPADLQTWLEKVEGESGEDVEEDRSRSSSTDQRHTSEGFRTQEEDGDDDDELRFDTDERFWNELIPVGSAPETTSPSSSSSTTGGESHSDRAVSASCTPSDPPESRPVHKSGAEGPGATD